MILVNPENPVILSKNHCAINPSTSIRHRRDAEYDAAFDAARAAQHKHRDYDGCPSDP